jgi:hypothetical protein
MAIQHDTLHIAPETNAAKIAHGQRKGWNIFYYINRFINISLDEKLLFLETILYLAFARFLILFVPMKRFAPLLGKEGTQAEIPFEHTYFQRTKQIKRNIKRAVKITPFRTKCFEQSIAAKLMMKRRGIPSTLCLGVRKNGNVLEAHAWVNNFDLNACNKEYRVLKNFITG